MRRFAYFRMKTGSQGRRLVLALSKGQKYYQHLKSVRTRIRESQIYVFYEAGWVNRGAATTNVKVHMKSKYMFMYIYHLSLSPYFIHTPASGQTMKRFCWYS